MTKTVAFIRSTNIYDDSRATKEIISLVEAGYHVVVLGWDRNNEAKNKTKEVLNNLDIELCFFHCILPNGIGIKNIDKLIKWNCWIKKKLRQIDCLVAVHACNLDAGYGAFQFCRAKHLPLIYDIYDYYIDSHSIPCLLRSFVEGLEIRIINFADLTIICTEERKAQIKKSHPKKLIVIHNSPDVPELGQLEEKYDYAYCGSLCDKRLIKEIIQEYPSYSQLKIAFAGNDIYKQFIESESKKRDYVVFLGTIPYSDVLTVEMQSKVLSAIYEPTIRNHRLCAPNKFYESLALGKPIIVCRGTGIDKQVEKYKIGVVINYSAKEFFEALLGLLKNDEERYEMGKRGRLLYERKYAWAIMKKRLMTAYNELKL